MTYEEQLNELLNKLYNLQKEIENFVNDNESEFINEICSKLNLDSEKNQVRVYAILGHAQAFYKDNSFKWPRTCMLQNFGKGWELK